MSNLKANNDEAMKKQQQGKTMKRKDLL
jgi:hypothetical protein